MMKKSSEFIEGFMKKLGDDKFEKDNQPNMGPEIGSDFIEKQLVSYVSLLNSGLIDAAICKG